MRCHNTETRSVLVATAAVLYVEEGTGHINTQKTTLQVSQLYKKIDTVLKFSDRRVRYIFNQKCLCSTYCAPAGSDMQKQTSTLIPEDHMQTGHKTPF